MAAGRTGPQCVGGTMERAITLPLPGRDQEGAVGPKGLHAACPRLIFRPPLLRPKGNS